MNNDEEVGCEVGVFAVNVQVCQLKEGHGTLVTCNWCQRGVHLHCHDPVLKTKPQDTWHCSGCETIVLKRDAARAMLARRALRGMNGICEVWNRAGMCCSKRAQKPRGWDSAKSGIGQECAAPNGRKSQGAGTSQGGEAPAKVKVCSHCVFSQHNTLLSLIGVDYSSRTQYRTPYCTVC